MSKKQIKLTVTEEMFNALKVRSEKMSLSVPSLCCYYIGERLYQTDLAENTSVSAVKEIFGNISIDDFKSFIDDEKKE